MRLLFKFAFFFFTLLITTTSFSQIDMEAFAGKSYGALYKEIQKDSTFIGCRLLASTPNSISGVELYFDNEIHYVVSFKKGRLDDSYNCDSFGLRGAKIYVIHSFKDKDYQKGFCRCNVDEKGQAIKASEPNEAP